MDQPTHASSSTNSKSLGDTRSKIGTKNRAALLLVNERARSGTNALNCARENLAQRGFHVITPKFDSPAQFSDLIVHHAHEVELVVIGGGDGSIRASLSGLLGTGLPLGVVPLGTANNLARNLGIETNIETACDVLTNGDPTMIDVAEVNGVYFLNVAGLGLSVKVNREVPHESKRRWGVLAYATTAYRAWREMRAFRATLVCDGEMFTVRSQQITVCNGRHFGSGLIVEPNASIDDGRLDIISLDPKTAGDVFGSARALVFGRDAKPDAMKRFSVADLEIRTRRPLWIDTDGEVLTQTPARFRIHRNALRVIAPRKEKESAVERARETRPERDRPSELTL